MSNPKVILKPGRDRALLRGHLWVFSGAISRTEGDPEEGAPVDVFAHDNTYLATGHYEGHSIAVRILSRTPVELTPGFWRGQLARCLAYRRTIGYCTDDPMAAFRLAFGEGDALPGLVLDYYAGLVVMETHSMGMYRARHQIAEAIQTLEGLPVHAIYLRAASTLGRRVDLDTTDTYLSGCAKSVEITENGHHFHVAHELGQKTGFFLDQRENRLQASAYMQSAKLLDAFCCSGSFSIYALQAGAAEVDSVDSSQRALDSLADNIKSNLPVAGKQRSVHSDVMPFLKATDSAYDVIILDPPAFAKGMRSRHKAVQGYKRLNALAMRRLRQGGLLFTFSCSQVVGRELFEDTLTAAAIEAQRPVRIVRRMMQAPDHPVNICHPETDYLKGLLLHIE